MCLVDFCSEDVISDVFVCLSFCHSCQLVPGLFGIDIEAVIEKNIFLNMLVRGQIELIEL